MPEPSPPTPADVDVDVFDCHHHVGDVSALLDGGRADVPAASPAGPGVEPEMARRLAIMDAGGVRQAAVIPATPTSAPTASRTPAG